MIRNVIFDWSGTLVDDLQPVLDATNGILREFGKKEMTREEFRRSFRLPYADFWSEHLPEVALEGLEQMYHRFFVNLQDNVTPLPGAREILEECRSAGRRIFLLSTIRGDHFEVQSRTLGLQEYFDEACVRAFDKRQSIRDLMARHAMKPEETVFLGDMVHDIEAARHGGVLSVALLTGFDPVEKLLAANPDMVARDLNVVRRFLGGTT